MPTISIKDFTGSADLDLANNGLLSDQKLAGLQTAQAIVGALQNPVTDPTFRDAKCAAIFEKPTIPFEGNTVDIKASVNSVLSVSRAADSPLFGQDNYDAVEIRNNECWVGVELDTLLDTSVAVPLPQGFGLKFEASAASAFSTYKLIADADAPQTTLRQGLSEALSAFGIIATPVQAMNIPSGLICMSDLSGALTVSGSWSLPLGVNQMSLAAANLPFNASVAARPLVGVQVGGAVSITGEFAIRFRQLTAGLIRVGVYKKEGTTLAASFAVSAGLGADVGGTDLISAVLSALFPGVNTSGLSKDDAAKFQQVLKDSLNHSLSISLNAACSAAHSDEAAMVFEVDTTAGDPASTREALGSALTGDWTKLAALANVRPIRNFVRETIERKFSLTINLLGLYNYRSIGDFLLSMKVVKNEEDGSVVITDTGTAKRITTASAPLAAKPDQLRMVLFESFLATATYQALAAGIGFGVTLNAQQDVLIYKDSMGYRDAWKQLGAGVILGVMPQATWDQMPAAGPKVRHARIAANCEYDNDDVMRFFFADIQMLTPRRADDLKLLGRRVLAALLDPLDSVDQARREHLLNQSLWDAMDGNPAQIPPPFLSDWLDVTEWAEAVAKVAPLLADTIAYGKSVHGDPTADEKFMEKRRNVALAINSVLHNTNAAFDHLFPICVMASLAGRTPGHDPAPVFEAVWNSQTIFSDKAQTQVATSKAAGGAEGA
jgi:hypothetical protein